VGGVVVSRSPYWGGKLTIDDDGRTIRDLSGEIVMTLGLQMGEIEPTTVREILGCEGDGVVGICAPCHGPRLSEWLEAHNYDGLYSEDEPCGCGLDDLIPCGECCSDCQPARHVDCTPDCPARDECEYPDQGGCYMPPQEATDE
jgi:hypothetical protein